MAVTDLVLLDIKEINEEQHKNCDQPDQQEYLGLVPSTCLTFGKPVWIRHVLVPGLTDRDDDLIELGKICKNSEEC